MKQLLTFTCLFLFAVVAYAQTDKNPKKDKTSGKETKVKPPKEPKRKAAELRKEFKEQYKDPEKFSQLKKDNATAKKEADKLNEEASRMKKNEDVQKEQVESLKQMNAEDEAKIKELQEAIRKKNESTGKKQTSPIPTTGTYYAVHIGEADQEILGKILANGTDELRNSQDASGHNFYVLGLFPDAKAAHALKQQITAMGIRKANVVTIKNGKLSM